MIAPLIYAILLQFGMKTFRLVAINVLIFFALFAGLELFFRAKGSPANSAIEQPNGMQLHILPYVMFANEAYSRYSTWQNIFTGQNEKVDIRVNNEGYNDPHDFDWRKPYTKAANEKVVLLVGGSTVWGVGSTGFTTTIAGALQSELARARPIPNTPSSIWEWEAGLHINNSLAWKCGAANSTRTG